MTEGKERARMAGHTGRMSKIFIISGIAVLALSALATLASVLTGAAQWIGLVQPLNLSLPPQSLVVGGLFLGIPIAALGWGLIWFGGWMKNHR